MKKNQSQVDGEQPSFIIMSIDYETKLILPIKKGLEFMHIWATAREIKESYNKPKKIQGVVKEFNIRFVTGREIKQMIVESMIEPNQEK
jgi:hypothetical protein